MFAARQGFFSSSSSGSYFGNNLDVTPNNCLLYTPASGTTPTGMVNWINTGGFTVEYWVYVTAYPGSLSPGPGNSDGTTTNYWTFGPANSGQLVFYFYNGSSNYIKTASSTLALNTWYNISAVCTTTGGNTTVTMYVNGVRQSIQLNFGSFGTSQTVTGGTYSTSVPFSLGKYNLNYLSSYMDNLRVSNVNRYTGASYTVARQPFTVDSNTQLLIEPTGTVGSSTIAYQSTLGNGTMTNQLNFVKISNTHYNHT